MLQAAFGMVLAIEGTSRRVVESLHAMGLSISISTIDQVRERLSDDAINSAKELLSSARPWVFVFDCRLCPARRVEALVLGDS